MPLQFKIAPVLLGEAIVFGSHQDARRYLVGTSSLADTSSMRLLFCYEVVYNDGAIFQRDNLNSNDALKLHDQVGRVAEHFSNFHNKVR